MSSSITLPPPPTLVSHTAASTLFFLHTGVSADGGTGWIHLHDFTLTTLNRLVKEHPGALVSSVEWTVEEEDFVCCPIVLKN